MNAADRWDNTPLDDALREGHKKIVLLLKENNAHASGVGLLVEEFRTSGMASSRSKFSNLDLLSSGDAVDRKQASASISRDMPDITGNLGFSGSTSDSDPNELTRDI